MELAAHLGVYIQLGKLVNVDIFNKGYYAVEAQLLLVAKHANVCDATTIVSARPVAIGTTSGEGTATWPQES
jgi:hypothetical protein